MHAYLTAHYILIIAAFIVALLAAFQWITAPRVNLVALALALFFLSLLTGCTNMTPEQSAQWSATGNAIAQQTAAVVLDEAAIRLRQQRKMADNKDAGGK